MRVMISSTKFSGHLNPLLPYAEALILAGHDVVLAAPVGASDRLAQAGIAHLSVAEPSDADTEAARLGIDAASGTEAVRAAIAGLFVEVSRARLSDLSRLMKDWNPDIVLRESLELGALVAAAAAGVPCARVGVHCGQGEMDFIPNLLAPIDGLRLGLGLPADNGASLRREPVFSAFPDFMDEDVDWLGTEAPFRIRPDTRVSSSPGSKRPHWAPSEGETFVYATLGTVSGRSEKSRAAYRAAIEALADLPVRALLTTGPIMSRDELGAIPPNVLVESFVPQSQVLPLAHAVVCHGGSGSLLGALAHGLPVVVMPLFADQPYNAASIARVGAGISVTERTVPILRAAFSRILDDEKIRLIARQIANDMAEMPGVDAAVARLRALAAGNAA